MPTKQELVAEKGERDAEIVVNNAFIDGISSQLKKKQEYGLTFPKDYNPSNELMGAYLILKETTDTDKRPVLESCSPTSIANTLMEMVTNGVSMQKKQCYPVAYKGKLQCQMSVYGNTCIARRYGLKTISAICIYEGDTFEYHIDDGEIVIDKHTQDFENLDTEKIKGAYAIAKMQDGTKHVELMNMIMIKKAWSQGYGYRENGNGTHQKFTDQMVIKTVKNRCLKFIIRTYGTPGEEDFLDKSDALETADKVKDNAEYEIAQNASKKELEFPDDEVSEVESEVTIEASEVEHVDGEVVPTKEGSEPDFLH